MLYVVRHGETKWNQEKRLQGRAGLPLNEAGLQQAEQLRERLRDVSFDYVISSPQERAIQTAEIATGLRASIDQRLDVFDLGEAEGLLRSEAAMKGGIPDPKIYKGVENTRDFMKRIFHFMRELEEKHAGGEEVNILLSGHRCTTGCIGAYFEGVPDDGNILKYSSGNGEYKVYPFAR
jgi:uncharacterized phosphatase